MRAFTNIANIIRFVKPKRT